MTPEITKAKVLEVFMANYNRLSNLPDRRRLMEADAATRDAFAPWYEGMPPEERARLDTVVKLTTEILTEDFGIKVIEGGKLTPFQDEVSKIGFAAGKEFLRHSAHLVPPFPYEVSRNAEWSRKMESLALDAVPGDRLADKEWTKNFIAAFVGELFMYQRDRR